MYTSYIHGRDPGKLSNSQKWSKPLPSHVQLKKKQNVEGLGSQLGEAIRKSTVNKGKFGMQIQVIASSIGKSF